MSYCNLSSRQKKACFGLRPESSDDCFFSSDSGRKPHNRGGGGGGVVNTKGLWLATSNCLNCILLWRLPFGSLMRLNKDVSDLHPQTYFSKANSSVEDARSAAQGRWAAFPAPAPASCFAETNCPPVVWVGWMVFYFRAACCFLVGFIWGVGVYFFYFWGGGVLGVFFYVYFEKGEAQVGAPPPRRRSVGRSVGRFGTPVFRTRPVRK